MAVNYTSLFTCLGEVVERTDEFIALYTTLDGYRDEIVTDFTAQNRENIQGDVYDVFDGFKSDVLGWIDSMVVKAEELLTDRITVLTQLDVGSDSSTTNVILELIRVLNDASQSVDASAVTVGSVSADKANTNAGTMITGKVLDGVSQPHPGFSASLEYSGVTSELAAATDTITATCTADSETDGFTEGEETFELMGLVEAASTYHWDAYGSGSGPTISPVQGSGLILNHDFETFTTTNVPDDWTIDAGAATTNVLRDTDSADVYHGSSSLRLLGNASAASIKLSQTLAAGSVIPGKGYFFACYIKGNSSLSQGEILIRLEDGAGSIVGQAASKIEMNQTALAAQTAYGLESFFVSLPAELPASDALEITIDFKGTPSAHDIHIDWVGLREATYFDGVAFGMVAGTDEFLRGDRFKSVVTNNEAGTFQKFFRKAFGVQLPSHGGGSETQADSLAE
jgi:hypothetical protein